MARDSDGLVRLLKGLDLLFRQLDIQTAYVYIVRNYLTQQFQPHDVVCLPRMSARLSKLVVPTMGAVTPGLVSTHAMAICAMLTPFFLASSSTLHSYASTVSHIRGMRGV